MTALASSGQQEQGPDDRRVPYRLVVPTGWVRLPMDPVGMREAARAMLLRAYPDRGRDETARLRHALEGELVALTRRPGNEYARMLLVLAQRVQDRPISASCLVSLLPRRVEGEAGLQELAAEGAEGALASVVEDLGDNRGVVVVRDQVVALPEGVDVEAQGRALAARELGRPVDEPLAAPPGTTRMVEVHLPVPDSDLLLLLSFSTSLVPLFDALTELFLLVASTVQWQREPGSWA